VSERVISGFGQCAICGEGILYDKLVPFGEHLCLRCAKKLYEGFQDLAKEVRNETEDG